MSQLRPERFRALRAGGAYGVILFTTFCALGPTLWVVISSFKTNPQILSGEGVVPSPATMRGYGDVFEQADLQVPLLNNFMYAAGGSSGALICGLLAAYPITRMRFPGRLTLAAVFSAGLAIPVISLVVPEYFIMRQLGLFDSKAGLILFYSALFFPLSFVIQRAFLASLPPEIEEAARIDGAGYFTIVRTIIVPVAVPGLVTVAVLVFIGIWNEFFFANLLTISNDNWNAQLALAQLKGQFNFNISAALAGACLVIIVPILMFLFLQRYVVAGLTAGASK